MGDEGRRWQVAGTAADAYEEFLVPAIFGGWAAELVEVGDPRPGERVLDVACGTGTVARAAAPRVQPHGSVTATDVNPDMLAAGRRATGDDPAISWRQADATALTVPTGSFDIVFCQQGLQFVTDRDEALREMGRVLAPGGRVALAVWCGIEQNPAFGHFVAALDRHSPAAGAMMLAPFGFGGYADLRAALDDAGFGAIRVRRHVRLSRFPSPAEFLRREAIASPLAGPLGALDERARRDLEADIEETLAPYVDDDGLAMPLEALLADGRH